MPTALTGPEGSTRKQANTNNDTRFPTWVPYSQSTNGPAEGCGLPSGEVGEPPHSQGWGHGLFPHSKCYNISSSSNLTLKLKTQSLEEGS